MRNAVARRPHLQPRDRTGVERLGRTLEDDRQHVGDRRSGVAALRERPRPAEHEQAAAALLDEVGNHAQLIAGEGAGLDAAENQPAVGKELLARLRESAEQVIGIVDAEAEVFVVGRPLQRHQPQVGVVLHGAADELQLEARLPFEIEDALGPVADVDQRLAHVVLRHHLAGTRRDLEAEDPRDRLPTR